MIEALGSPGAFFVPKMPLFRAKSRLKKAHPVFAIPEQSSCQVQHSVPRKVVGCCV